MAAISAYPLCWPDGWQRTPPGRRGWGNFDSTRTRDKALAGLFHEIELLGGKHVIVSSMLKLRQDGLPYSAQKLPDDPGIAVYFEYKGKQTCFACDEYTKDVSNIWAIKLTIEALRGIKRWGASDMMDRAFTGFAALPPPQVNIPWYVVLDLSPGATLEQIETRYRTLAKQRHPDVPGGSTEAFQELQSAYESAKAAKNG